MTFCCAAAPVAIARANNATPRHHHRFIVVSFCDSRLAPSGDTVTAPADAVQAKKCSCSDNSAPALTGAVPRTAGDRSPAGLREADHHVRPARRIRAQSDEASFLCVLQKIA